MSLVTLYDVREFIYKESSVLDRKSRYVRELLDLVGQAENVGQLEGFLLRSRGCYWAGDAVWSRMTLEEKLRANLITNETEMMRFSAYEIDHLRSILTANKDKDYEILSLPCSHGEEAVTLAGECMEVGLRRFKVTGFDVQPACIEAARKGKFPISRWVTGHVDPKLMEHLEFQVQDVFSLIVNEKSKKYDLVVCRNFLGYFKPDVAREILVKVFDLTKDPGYVLLDSFILKKDPDLFQSMARLKACTSPFFMKDSQGVLAPVYK